MNYDTKNWKLLSEQLLKDSTKIHHLNRIQLIADSHVLAADAMISLAIPIRMFTYMKNEEDPLVWLSAFDSFERLYFALGLESRQLYQVSKSNNIDNRHT